MIFLEVINEILADEHVGRKELDLNYVGWLAMLIPA